MSRLVTLVLVSGTGQPLGTLPPFPVESPWWPDVEPVITAAREIFGIDITVLRLLEAAHTSNEMGGPVTYAAELLGTPETSLRLVDDVPDTALEEHPLRMPWARIGAIADILAWADEVLARSGLSRSGAAAQVKSWNLSCILRLPTPAGDVWCKSVAPVAALQRALIYRQFRDGIEASERCYHAEDVAQWLRRAIGGAAPS